MLDPLIAFCTSTGGLIWLLIASDLSIALAYFAIPVVMAVVLRERREDIPYPWLWTLFVTFIVACGLTHTVHLASAYMGVEYLRLQTIVEILTALASVGTAVAFAVAAPATRGPVARGGRADTGERSPDPRNQSPDRQSDPGPQIHGFGGEPQSVRAGVDYDSRAHPGTAGRHGLAAH